MNGLTLTWKRNPEKSITPIGEGVYVVPVQGASLETRAAMLSRLLPHEVVVARRTAAWPSGFDVLPPGVHQADWPVDLIDSRTSAPGAHVPAESWTKVAAIDAGFPRPTCQVPVMGPHDRLLYVDLGYERFRVGLEYDGERHHTGSQARDRDHRRRKWLVEEQKWELIPVTRDFLYRPAPYLEALLTALLHRGWKPDDTLDRIGRRLRTLTRPRR
ncbi:hypothetical protein ACFHW2_16975 [Actinomadura sp. LOL_016]|uniref:hypothetical protein n=1 Tax=unclassified Actinomadura TaxID=2626254 RepID=UPI003A80118D